MNRHSTKTGSHCEQNCYDKIKQNKTKNKNIDSGKNKSKKIKKIMSKVNLLACLNSKNDESIEVKQEFDVGNDVEKIETEIFSRINANHKRFGVKINNDQDEIWTVAVNAQSKNTPIVLIHGYLAGIGIWRFNIDDLCESRPLYAIDLLGFGRSSRSQFGTDPIEVENQFVDSIEEWRKVMKLDKFVLLGHSFGGYIVTLYTLKYPQYIEKLILDDPWGFPDPSIDRPTNRLPVIRCFFESLVRRGKRNFKKEKDIENLSDLELLYKYFCSINSIKPPTGKEAAACVAVKYAFSKNPLINRIDKLSSNVPIWFIFGARSWIKSQDGFRVAEIRPETAKTFVKIIKKSGHNIHGERPEEFNSYVKHILSSIPEVVKNEIIN